MDNVDKLVKLITDRLLENLQSAPTGKSVYLIGGSQAVIEQIEQNGYAVVDSLQFNTDHVVVESSSVDALLRVAALCPTTNEESALVSALLQGKSVYIFNAALAIEEYKKTATSLLYRELLNQKQKLEKYGAKFCDSVSFLQKETQAPQMSLAANKRVVKSEQKTKLITESKLRDLDLQEGDVFVAKKGMIVTALAKDYLKRHKIILENER